MSCQSSNLHHDGGEEDALTPMPSGQRLALEPGGTGSDEIAGQLGESGLVALQRGP